MFTENELISMLESWGVEYELDSERAGIQYADGRFETYDEVPLPSEFLKEGDFNDNNKDYYMDY